MGSAWKDRNRADIVPEIRALAKNGFHVQEFTPYQFRVNDRLDLYPSRKRWHDIKTNTRGYFDGKVLDFVSQFFGTAREFNKHMDAVYGEKKTKWEPEYVRLGRKEST